MSTSTAADNAALMRSLAYRLVEAGQTSDLESLAGIFHDDAVIWHNTDNLTITMAENAAPCVKLFGKIQQLRYEDLEVLPFAGGYVQHHRMVGESVDGQPFDLAACAIMYVRDGKIARIEEYFDSAPLIGVGLDAWLPAK
jgi:ketosteroid isomerase-like protein